MSATFETIDRSGLDSALARIRPPLTWSTLRAELSSSRAQAPSPALGDRSGPRFLKAAAVLLIAGAAFVLGRSWDALTPTGLQQSSVGVPPPSLREGGPDSGRPEDAGWRLKTFSQETNGYLDRSRLVLLELSNSEAAEDSEALRTASRGLLRENPHARQVADKIDDPRIEELVKRLQGVLEEIARLSVPADGRSIDRIRSYVNDSGVLMQLEIMSATSDRWVEPRPRT
ncbi:MAG TPA: hypothetical protein VFG76_06285 [Candidatus Polarisedimenticolia bacterium]|nr:hypothetical protein [Candidatus Polarisedimenticolia bacterium]